MEVRNTKQLTFLLDLALNLPTEKRLLFLEKVCKDHQYGNGAQTNGTACDNHPSSSRYAQCLRQLFDAAIELSGEARAAYLAKACGNHPTLLERAKSFLTAFEIHDTDVQERLQPISQSSPVDDFLPQQIEQDEPATLTGREISHYQVLEKLGTGGMSVVHKARDTRLDRLVALKFLSPHLGCDDESRRRFIHEARAASALEHTNICTIYDIGETKDGCLFLVMSYYHGETIKQKVERGALPLKEVIDYAVQIADGLTRTHEAGIVHRDVKSANVMVTDEKAVKILDFGLAKLKGASSLTKSGTTLGTIAYMSPEQARGEQVDFRTDLWSLGVVMYEMLTGERPFRGEYDQAVIYSILNEDPEPIAGLREDAPEAVSEIINRLLSKDPEQRYIKTSDLLADLRLIRKTLRMDTDSKETVESQPALSVGVLPFINMSADPALEYFCDGISEDLINALSQVTDVRVAARTSAFTFKNHSADVHKIGRQLNVNVIVEGSVRKEGDRLRVTARLIDVADGLHLWSEQYNRTAEDTFTVQDELAMTILQRLIDTTDNLEKAA